MIDLMRGLAIWMMVVFHVIMRWYDSPWVEDGESEDVPLISLVFFAAVIFFGGWAGFFLLVSSVGNMISMQRSLGKGVSWKRIVMF